MLDSYNEFLDPNRDNVDYVIGNMDANLKLEDRKSLGMNPRGCTHFYFFKKDEEIPPSNYSLFPHQCKEKVKKFVKSRIENSFENCLSNAYKNGNFKWEILTDPENKTGADHFGCIVCSS